MQPSPRPPPAVPAPPRAGPLGGDRGDCRQSVREYATRTVFRCALVLLLRPRSRGRRARRTRATRSGRVRRHPVDNEWLFCMSLLADASERLGDSRPRRGRSTTSCSRTPGAMPPTQRDQPRSVSRSLGNAAARWHAGTKQPAISKRRSTRTLAWEHDPGSPAHERLRADASAREAGLDDIARAEALSPPADSV